MAHSNLWQHGLRRSAPSPDRSAVVVKRKEVAVQLGVEWPPPKRRKVGKRISVRAGHGEVSGGREVRHHLSLRELPPPLLGGECFAASNSCKSTPSKDRRRMMPRSGCLNLLVLLSTKHVAVLVVAFLFSLPALVVAPPLRGGLVYVQLSLLLKGRCHGKKELYQWTVSDNSFPFRGGGVGGVSFFLASFEHCHHSTMSQLRPLSSQKCWCTYRRKCAANYFRSTGQNPKRI